MDPYLRSIRDFTLSFLEKEDVRVILFGSRARNDCSRYSDVDIGIVPRGPYDRTRLVLLKERLEGLNVPYKVDLVDFSSVSKRFHREAEKEAVVWKD